MDANYAVNLQLLAKDLASGVVEGLTGKLGGLVKAGLAFGAIAAPVVAVTKALDECVKMAAAEEVGVVRMNAALKASFESNEEAAGKVAKATTKMVQAMAPEKMAATADKIQTLTARIHDQSAALAKSKSPTESATLALSKNQAQLATLTAQYAAGGKMVAVSTGGMQKAVEKIPGTWEDASKSVEKYLASRLRTTALDDGEGREAIQRLVESTGDYRKALEVMPIVEDLAAAKGMSLASAGMLIGRVTQGNTGILQRYGIILKKGATATEALAALQKKFGGQAEAYGKTYEGSQKRLEIAVGNIKETVGSKLLPLLATMAGGMANWLIDALPVIEEGATKFFKFVEPVTDWFKILFENLSDNRGILYSVGSGLEYLAETLLGVKNAQGFGTAFGDFFTKKLPEVAKQLPLFRGMFENMLLGTRVDWQPLANALEALGASPELAAKAAGVATTITTYVQDAFDKVKLSYKEGGVSGVIEMMRAEAIKAWPMFLGSFDTLIGTLQEKLGELWGGRKITDEFGVFLGRVGGLRGTLEEFGIPESVLTSFDSFFGKLDGFLSKVSEAVKLLQGGDFRAAMEKLGVPEFSIVAMERVSTALNLLPGALKGVAESAPAAEGILKTLFDLFAGQIQTNLTNINEDFTGINTALVSITQVVKEDFIPLFEGMKEKLDPTRQMFNDIKGAVDGIIGTHPVLKAALEGIGQVFITLKDVVLNPTHAVLLLIKSTLESIIGLYEALKGLSAEGAAAIGGVPSLPSITKQAPGILKDGGTSNSAAGAGTPEVTAPSNTGPGVVLNMYNYDPDASELARRGTWKALAAIGAG